MTSRTIDTPHSAPQSKPSVKDKTYLDVHYDHRDIAKEYGARFDGNVKRWYYLPDARLAIIFSWRSGTNGIGGKQTLKVPLKQEGLAIDLGAGYIERSSQYCMNKLFHVERGTKLHLIYSWRRNAADYAPKAPQKLAPRFTVPTPPSNAASQKHTANPVTDKVLTEHCMKVNRFHGSMARALGIRFPGDRGRIPNEPEVIEGSWYAHILSWCKYVRRNDACEPHALIVPVQDQSLAEYMGARKTDKGWESIPGSTLHSALNWRTNYIP